MSVVFLIRQNYRAGPKVIAYDPATVICKEVVSIACLRRPSSSFSEQAYIIAVSDY